MFESKIWGEVRSACADELWSDAIQAINGAALERFDADKWEMLPPLISPAVAFEMLRYCARAATLSGDLAAVADFALAVVCEMGESWPEPLPHDWYDYEFSAGPYELRAAPSGDLWSWYVRCEGLDVDFGSEGSEDLARSAAVRAARRAVLVTVRELF